MEKLLFVYLGINLYALMICLIDKIKAVYNMWRISEKHLLLTSFVGGSIGMYLGMHIFRHKTKKAEFSIGVPVMIILHALIALYLFKKYNVDIVEFFKNISFLEKRI